MSEKNWTNILSQRFLEHIIHNLDISVVIPFYRSLEIFRKVLPGNAQYLQRNGIEVIIALDSPEEEIGLIDLIKGFPFINWKVIVNDIVHESRNLAPILNVAIRNATKKYIMVLDPEAEFFSDVIFELRNILENYPSYYATDIVGFKDQGDQMNEIYTEYYGFSSNGNMMLKKEFLQEICGYDESFKKLRGEGANIRKRLEIRGIRRLTVPMAKSFYREKNVWIKKRLEMTSLLSSQSFKRIYYPLKAIANSISWGTEFHRTCYNWQNNKYAEELCLNYLSCFTKYKILEKSIFKTKFRRIILAQSYNEIELMEGFLGNMSKYFDGIILLDDSSSDGTYEQAMHEKLLIKVQKKRKGFNDLENRNILLNIASFFKSDWFCFMDIDERIDERFSNFDEIIESYNGNAINFYFVNIWDKIDYYNTNIPKTDRGIFIRARMFRNIGRTQIITTKKKLHFAATPFKEKGLYAPILIKHLGLISKEHRLKKYNFYKKEDKHNDQTDYEYLLSESPEIKHIDEIFLKYV